MQPTLAQSLAAGDPAAFATLYDQLACRLFGTARIMTGSTTDAEDIVHDLFVDLARGRSRLAGVADLDAYVFTMLRHAVSRRRRRAAVVRQAVTRIANERLRSGSMADQPPTAPDDALETAMAALPSEQREVVALKIHGGLTFAEIAAAMNTSINTAASRYRYALDRLRQVIGPAETRR